MNEITVNVPVETVRAAVQALAKMPFEFAFQHIQILEQRHNAAIEAFNAANAAKQAAAAAPQADTPKTESEGGEA